MIVGLPVAIRPSGGASSPSASAGYRKTGGGLVVAFGFPIGFFWIFSVDAGPNTRYIACSKPAGPLPQGMLTSAGLRFFGHAAEGRR